MIKKITNFKNLSIIRNKNLKKKIVLVHGVFDLVHIGHVEYFKEAKKNGDILVVSITSKKFVNKGFNRPYFDDESRIKFISELSVVDYVVLSDNVSAVNIISHLKPNYYVKGPDYKIAKNDKAGNLKIEAKTVKKYGGELKFTNGKIFSSTAALNSGFEEFKTIELIKKNNLIKEIDKKKILRDYFSALKKIKKEKILVIGEIIIDNYFYSESLGTPSKENILSVNYLKKDKYFGGSLPVVKNISQLCDNVTFISLAQSKKLVSEIKKQINSNVNLQFFFPKNYKEVSKNRFIDINFKRKFFEFYEFNNVEIFNKELNKFLKNNLKKFDKVIVCDFGHGLFNKEVVSIIESNSNFSCINVQTNSGNRGYNLFSKYSKGNLLVLDEPELRLGLSERYSLIEEIVNNKKLKKFKNLMVTRGIRGLIYKNKKTNTKNFFSFPALSTKVVDTMGAGDAAFSYVSLFVNNTTNVILVGLISSIAAAIKTTIVGHETFVKKQLVERSLESIVK